MIRSELKFLFFALCSGIMAPALAIDETPVLFEYGHGSADETGDLISAFPIPSIKIWEDGRIIIQEKDGFRCGMLSPKKLTALKRYLNRHPILQKNQIIRIRDGKWFGLHGGIGYVAKGWGEEKVIVGFRALPTKGTLHRLIKRVKELCLQHSKSCLSEPLEVRISYGSKGSENIIWPFPQKPIKTIFDNARYPIAPDVKHTVISDKNIIRFLMKYNPDSPSSNQIAVKDGKDYYKLRIIRPAALEFDIIIIAILRDLDEAHRKKTVPSQ